MTAALSIIESDGLEALSLRDVARRLGVSHQAPYKHFESREHILAEIVARAFAGFAAHLDGRPPGPTAQEDLASMGRAYLGFAAAHPLQYELMFGATLPDPARHPAMMREARHAFSLLRDALSRHAAECGRPAAPGDLDRDALFVWSTMHGLASIRSSCAVDTLGLSPETLAAGMPHALARVGMALAGAAPAAGHVLPPSGSPENGEPRPAPDGPAPARRAAARPSKAARDDHR